MEYPTRRGASCPMEGPPAMHTRPGTVSGLGKRVKMGAEKRGPILAWPTSSPTGLLPRSHPPKSLQSIILNVPGFRPMTFGVPERGTHSLQVEMAEIKPKARPDLPAPAPSGARQRACHSRGAPRLAETVVPVQHCPGCLHCPQGAFPGAAAAFKGI